MKTMFFQFMLCICIATFAETSIDSLPPSLDKVSWSYIDSAMYYTGTTRLDPNFDKKWATDTLFMLEIVKSVLDRPLSLPETIDCWTRYSLKKRESVTDIVSWMVARLGYTPGNIRNIGQSITKIARADTTARQLPEPYGQMLRIILASFDVAAEHRSAMISKMSAESIDSLLFLLPTFWTDEEDTLVDSLRCYFLNLLCHECDTAAKIHLDSLYLLMHKFDLTQLGLATIAVVTGVNMSKQLIQTRQKSEIPASPIEIQTRWGKAIIGTGGTDIFGDAKIIIDPGGDDFYIGDNSAGVVGKGIFGVTIDCAGDDHYDSRKSVFTLASGIFGAGILADISGNDIYMSGHYGQAAGLFGSGILIDYDGEDSYHAGVFAQGAANFGIGALIDLNGNDSYYSYAYAQAFSGPMGFGLLLDFDGADNYFSGGKYSHAPLCPFDYHSFSQGFSIGWRPDVSGGIAMLLDNKGNDTYTCGVYGQGSSYWYSLGLLIDNYGNDIHNSVYYPQGSGIHLSIGALVDRGGDDIYISRQGPGQGAAHDWGVGFFSDYSGKDMYAIDGGNGCALTNSFTLFIDRNGDDMYSKRYDRSINFGYSGSARGTGGLSFFLDLEGQDKYNDEGCGNETYWIQGDIGIGIDAKGEPFPDPVKELAQKIADEEVDTPRTMEKIFSEAAGWRVGSAQEKVDKAFQELIDSGKVAADYICNHQLGTKSGLALDAIKRYSQKQKELMLPCLFEALHSENSLRRGNAIWLFGEIAETSAVDSLLSLLADERGRISIISALGKIKDKRAVKNILEWKNESRQKARYVIARSLSDIGDAQAADALLGYLMDDYLSVRFAAQYGLTNMYSTIFDGILSSIPCSRMPKRLHLVWIIEDMCSKMNADTTLDSLTVMERFSRASDALLSLLLDKNPAVRGYAVRALGMIGDERVHSILADKFELERNEFVRAMYYSVLKKNAIPDRQK